MNAHSGDIVVAQMVSVQTLLVLTPANVTQASMDLPAQVGFNAMNMLIKH